MKANAFGHCVHYNAEARFGIGKPTPSKTCHAGVSYLSVRVEPPIRRDGTLPIVVPCCSDARGVDEANVCPMRQWPTKEQIAEAQAETERIMDRVEKGLCPDCGGKMHRVERREGGGFVDLCPTCPDVSVRGCSRRDVGGA